MGAAQKCTLLSVLLFSGGLSCRENVAIASLSCARLSHESGLFPGGRWGTSECSRAADSNDCYFFKNDCFRKIPNPPGGCALPNVRHQYDKFSATRVKASARSEERWGHTHTQPQAVIDLATQHATCGARLIHLRGGAGRRTHSMTPAAEKYQAAPEEEGHTHKGPSSSDPLASGTGRAVGGISRSNLARSDSPAFSPEDPLGVLSQQSASY